MATHSSTPARKIPWTEEPGGLQSMGPQRVGQDRATSLSLPESRGGAGKEHPSPNRADYPGVSEFSLYPQASSLSFSGPCTSHVQTTLLRPYGSIEDHD